ncbi:hypothetical protein EFE23_26085 [Micromonospora solifontis]|uniref:Uncharacterized protein n=1 Tax=Micromonospora solifontis TaxID=2487138 RepID=A0ABX9W9N2_9ACTN|nr:hypothetical protein EFE23_26085 [Micromonospora solifontis]
MCRCAQTRERIVVELHQATVCPSPEIVVGLARRGRQQVVEQVSGDPGVDTGADPGEGLRCVRA